MTNLREVLFNPQMVPVALAVVDAQQEQQVAALRGLAKQWRTHSMEPVRFVWAAKNRFADVLWTSRCATAAVLTAEYRIPADAAPRLHLIDGSAHSQAAAPMGDLDAKQSLAWLDAALARRVPLFPLGTVFDRSLFRARNAGMSLGVSTLRLLSLTPGTRRHAPADRVCCRAGDADARATLPPRGPAQPTRSTHIPQGRIGTTVLCLKSTDWLLPHASMKPFTFFSQAQYSYCSLYSA